MTRARPGHAQWLLHGLERLFGAGVRFYQAALRPLNPWGCKFYPSCSEYALEAVERHGLGRGGWLMLARLGRCRPGVFGGYDPVPEPGNAANESFDSAGPARPIRARGLAR